jgi:hypothetical protein
MLLPDESNTDASRRSIAAGNTSCRFLMNWYGSFVPRQPGCKLLPKLLDTQAYTKLSSLTLLNPAGSAFAPVFFARPSRLLESTAKPHPPPHDVQRGEGKTPLWVIGMNETGLILLLRTTDVANGCPPPYA